MKPYEERKKAHDERIRLAKMYYGGEITKNEYLKLRGKEPIADGDRYLCVRGGKRRIK